MITKKDISDQLLAYLQHRLSLSELSDWAENTLMRGEYEDDAKHSLRSALAPLGPC